MKKRDTKDHAGSASSRARKVKVKVKAKPALLSTARPGAQPGTTTQLRRGYRVSTEQRPDADVLSLQAADGRLLLRVVLSADGPLFEIESAALSVSTRGPLRLDCERLEINARQDLAIRAQNLTYELGGDMSASVGGVIASEARAQHHRARLGDLTLEANDDLCLDGERVRLNSPRPARAVQPRPPSLSGGQDALSPSGSRPAGRPPDRGSV